MNTYFIHRIGTNEPTSVKAKTKAEAIVKYIDTWWQCWFGPSIVDDYFEIYSVDGTKLKFKIT